MAGVQVLGLFPEFGTPGGVQQVCRLLAAASTAYAAGRGLSAAHLALNDGPGLHFGGVGGDGFTYRGFARAKASFTLAALRAAAGGAGVVVVAHPNLAPAAVLATAMSKRRRIVAVAYGIEVWTPLPALRRAALRRADLVVAISTDTRRRVTAVQGVREERVRVIPVALDPAFATGPLRTSGGGEIDPAPGAGPVILTVARLQASERYKGVDTLLEAIALLQRSNVDVRLLIVGDGDDRPRLEAQARGLDVGRRVSFLGHVTAPTLAACYRRCDVFAMPSGGEGFGLVFVEAMAHGKVVIGAAVGGTVDVIEDGVTGLLVPYGDALRLADAVRRVLADEGFRRALGERAMRHVIRAYDYQTFRERVWACLDELCAS